MDVKKPRVWEIYIEQHVLIQKDALTRDNYHDIAWAIADFSHRMVNPRNKDGTYDRRFRPMSIDLLYGYAVGCSLKAIMDKERAELAKAHEQVHGTEEESGRHWLR